MDCMDGKVLAKYLNQDVFALFDGVPGLYKVSDSPRSLIAMVMPDPRGALILPILLIRHCGLGTIVEYERKEIAPADRIRIRVASMRECGGASLEPKEDVDAWYDIREMLWAAHVRSTNRLRRALRE